MDDAAAWKLGITIFGILGTFAVTLIGIVIGRLYKSIDVLFEKLDKERTERLKDRDTFAKQIGVLKLAALKNDPEGTALFNALTRNGGDHG